MNRGLFAKTFRETWPTALLVGLGMMAFKALLAFIAPQIAGQMGASMLQMDFVRNIIQTRCVRDCGRTRDQYVGLFDTRRHLTMNRCECHDEIILP